MSGCQRLAPVLAFVVASAVSTLGSAQEAFRQPPWIYDELLESRFQRFGQALRDKDIALVFTFFDPAHMLDNLYSSDLDLQYADSQLMDRAVCEWGFMVRKGNYLGSLLEIREVRALYMDFDDWGSLILVFEAQLEDGSVNSYYSFIDEDTWLLSGASG